MFISIIVISAIVLLSLLLLVLSLILLLVVVVVVHLSDTTCLIHVFFKRGEERSKVRRSLARHTTLKTKVAVLDG